MGMQTKPLTSPSFQKLPLLQPQAITSCFPSLNIGLNLDEMRNVKTRMNEELQSTNMKTKQIHTIDDFQKDLDWVSFDEDAISP